MSLEIPDGYDHHVLDDVVHDGDGLTLKYAGRVFGGVLPELLEADVLQAVLPGSDIIVRYHRAAPGQPATQIAHLLVRDRRKNIWAELYTDEG
ncbi:MAG: hypothetical protein ACE5GE_13165 [Phycisphaerae bacterium]